MNFGQNLYQWFLSNAQSLVLMAIVVIGIYLGFKREFSKLIGRDMRMDSGGILLFSFFFYAQMKGRIATISFGCLWINKFKKGGTHMKETKIYADEFCTTFASTTEMLEFLAERAKQSKWIRKPTRMLKLVPLEKEAETIEEACEKELEGIVEDTEKNTQLGIKSEQGFLSGS